MNNPFKKALLVSLAVFCNHLAAAEKTKQEIAKEVANPLTSLTYLPMQLDFDRNIGPEDDGERMTLNIQPLTSWSINDEWNLISRTIVPLIAQDDIFPGAGDQSGFGDIVQSFFFSPEKATKDGWIWGAGPAILAPTASDDLLGTGKWAAGPTFVAAKVDGPWTYGVLTNHLSSFAGDNDRDYINDTFVQPFFDYTTEGGLTYELTTETNYSWQSEEFSIPVIFTLNQFVQMGDQMMMIGGGLRYWAKSTDDDPEGLGFNISVYFLFP